MRAVLAVAAMMLALTSGAGFVLAQEGTTVADTSTSADAAMASPVRADSPGNRIRERLDDIAPLSPVGRLSMALLLAGLFLVIGRATARLRTRLNETGVLPRSLAIVGRLSVATAGLLVVWGGVAFLPTMAPTVLWGTLAAILALVLVGAWGLLPDVFAGAVLLVERRVQVGLRVEGEGFAGTVMRTTWRSIWLRTPRGRLEIPNRLLLAGPTQVSRSAEHELTLELESTASARQRIEDAVLASAFTPPTPKVRVHRDPRHPRRWVVHTRLLHPRFAPAFDADLPARVAEAGQGPDAGPG